MSLDIAILGPEGSPKKQISIGADDHHRLMELIGGKGLLARLNDYYADAEFEPSEVEDLMSEATALSIRCNNDKQLFSFLSGLIELCRIARSDGTSLVAIAD
jgi:hypothetical protein